MNSFFAPTTRILQHSHTYTCSRNEKSVSLFAPTAITFLGLDSYLFDHDPKSFFQPANQHKHTYVQRHIRHTNTLLGMKEEPVKPFRCCCCSCGCCNRNNKQYYFLLTLVYFFIFSVFLWPFLLVLPSPLDSSTLVKLYKCSYINSRTSTRVGAL